MDDRQYAISSKARKDFIDILEVYRTAIEVLMKEPFPMSELEILEGLTGKLLNHAASALVLSEGTRISEMTPPVDCYDHASLQVITRAVVEAYAAFHHLFVDPKDDDQKRFRFLYHEVRGLSDRINMPSRDATIVALQQQDIKARSQILQQIEATNEFKSLKPDQQKRVRDGTYGTSKTRMIERAGYPPKYTQIVYNFLSDHTHSGYQGVRQSRTANTWQAQAAFAQLAIGIISLALFMAIEAIRDKYPNTSATIKAHPKAPRVFSFMSSERKTLFDRAS